MRPDATPLFPKFHRFDNPIPSHPLGNGGRPTVCPAWHGARRRLHPATVHSTSTPSNDPSSIFSMHGTQHAPITFLFSTPTPPIPPLTPPLRGSLPAPGALSRGRRAPRCPALPAPCSPRRFLAWPWIQRAWMTPHHTSPTHPITPGTLRAPPLLRVACCPSPFLSGLLPPTNALCFLEAAAAVLVLVHVTFARRPHLSPPPAIGACMVPPR